MRKEQPVSEPLDQEIKKLMRLKRIACGALAVMILWLVLVFVAVLLENLGLEFPDVTSAGLVVLVLVMAPTFRFHEKIKNPQHGICGAEEHLQAARRLYNANVSSYNIAMFPASLLAKGHSPRNSMTQRTRSAAT